MLQFKQIILFFFLALPAAAQQPAFTWGPAINYESGKLDHMQVAGVNGTGFYTTYEEDYQVTLERYNNQNQRLWAVALLPKTPEGQTSRFLGAVLLHKKLYILSTFYGGGHTSVYAQRIHESGNYDPEIIPLVSSTYGNSVTLGVAPDKNALLLVQTDVTGGPATVTLFSHDLHSRWSRDFTPDGTVQEVAVQSDGTAFILTRAGATAASTAAFHLYRFGRENGELATIALGQGQYRPLQARLHLTPGQDVMVAGYFVRALSVVTQNPEPLGTFYYHLDSTTMQNPAGVYTLFDPAFLRNYKRYRADRNHNQRLRSLQLGPLVPTGENGLALLGEVTFAEAVSGSVSFNFEDIIITSLQPDGTPRYVTSINKEQHTTRDNSSLGSYFATAIGDTLQIVYLSFDNNDTPAVAAKQKMPVLVSITPDGRQQVSLLRYAGATGTQFYLRPATTFPVSEREFIVLGIGDGYYKYGRMRF
ncbi:hypothetical protein I2I11_05800 [Pontibacter sp. 172403-2]|uniref:hypothetical protein n=1 Tax=Pontibacter rufus TaxID=2791028 RepID=UPI0018AFCB40|nr:hypothetical protein [Pontibacter sp. 172403-2]MBF9252794.1 hypothetical protein [Pontibacter sp. 172403-2]